MSKLGCTLLLALLACWAILSVEINAQQAINYKTGVPLRRGEVDDTLMPASQQSFGSWLWNKFTGHGNLAVRKWDNYDDFAPLTDQAGWTDVPPAQSLPGGRDPRLLAVEPERISFWQWLGAKVTGVAPTPSQKLIRPSPPQPEEGTEFLEHAPHVADQDNVFAEMANKNEELMASLHRAEDELKQVTSELKQRLAGGESDTPEEPTLSEKLQHAGKETKFKLGEKVEEGIHWISDEGEQAGEQVEHLYDTVRHGFDKLRQGAANVGRRVKQGSQRVVEEEKEWLGEKAERASHKFQDIYEKGKDAAESIKVPAQGGRTPNEQFLAYRQEKHPSSIPFHTRLARDTWNLVTFVPRKILCFAGWCYEKTLSAGDKIEGAVDEAGERIQDRWENARETVAERAQRLKDMGATEAEEAFDTVGDIRDRAKDYLWAAKQKVQEGADASATSMKHGAAKVAHTGKEMLDDVKEAGKEGAAKLAHGSKQAWAQAKKSAEDFEETVYDTAEATYEGAREGAQWVRGKGSQAADAAKHGAEEVLETAKSGTRVLKDKGENIKEHAKDSLQYTKEKAADTAQAAKEVKGRMPSMEELDERYDRFKDRATHKVADAASNVKETLAGGFEKIKDKIAQSVDRAQQLGREAAEKTGHLANNAKSREDDLEKEAEEIRSRSKGVKEEAAKLESKSKKHERTTKKHLKDKH